MTEFVLTPIATGVESLIFDPDSNPVEVTNMADYRVQAFEYTPAKPRTEWLESADSDGAIPTNEVHWTNAEATLKIRVAEQATSDAARAAISAVVDKAMKGRRMVDQGERGLPVLWTPKDSALEGTLYLIEADSWSVPIVPSGDDFGYNINTPVFTVHLTLAPGVEMPEVETAETTWATPVGSIEVSPQGELRTPATLILTDLATTARKTVQIGQERYSYGAADLWLDESELTETTPSNSVADADASGGNAIQLLSLVPGWQDVAIRSGDTRRGTFRIFARVKSTADEEEVRVRLKWRVGSGPYTVNFVGGVVVAPFATAAYVEVDLGTVNVPAGAANLEMVVQAQSNEITSVSEGIRVDALNPQPVERSATVSGEEVIAGGQTLAVYDDLDDGTGFLDGDTPPFVAAAYAPGTWAAAGASGATQEWERDDGWVVRDPASADADLNTGAYASVGGTLTDGMIVIHFEMEHTGKTTGQETRGGAFLRYTDENNWVAALIRIRRKSNGGYSHRLRLYKRNAGTVTKLRELNVADIALTANRGKVSGSLALAVAGTTMTVSVGKGSGYTNPPTEEVLTETDAALGTAALNDGEAGIYHTADFGDKSKMKVFNIAVYSSTGATTHTYAIPSGGRLELDGDEAISYSAPTGGTAVPVKHRGAPLWLEPAGDEAQMTRLAIKTRDAAQGEAEAVAALTRSTKAKLAYKPRFLAYPGS